jgi:hypothetical protein
MGLESLELTGNRKLNGDTPALGSGRAMGTPSALGSDITYTALGSGRAMGTPSDSGASPAASPPLAFSPPDRGGPGAEDDASAASSDLSYPPAYSPGYSVYRGTCGTVIAISRKKKKIKKISRKLPILSDMIIS